jgi:hypothetical protein
MSVVVQLVCLVGVFGVDLVAESKIRYRVLRDLRLK